MLTQLTGHNLPQWITDVQAAGLPGLSSFAKGLEQDLGAVTWGLTSHWNSGPVQGRVNRIILWISFVKSPGLGPAGRR
jgi:transposase